MENKIDNRNGEGSERSVANEDTSILNDMPEEIDVGRLCTKRNQKHSHFDQMNWIYIAIGFIQDKFNSLVAGYQNLFN